jgi:hypothetical protein
MSWAARSIVAASVAAPVDAKEVRLMCPHCSASVYVTVPVGCTSLTRQERIKAAVDEHRRLCPSEDALGAVVYTISYPRA